MKKKIIKPEEIDAYLRTLKKDGLCLYCGGVVYSNGTKGGTPRELWYSTNRLKQILEKGVVHDRCFLRAFDKFNAMLSEKNQLKNHQILKDFFYFKGLGGNYPEEICRKVTLEEVRTWNKNYGGEENERYGIKTKTSKVDRKTRTKDRCDLCVLD